MSEIDRNDPPPLKVMDIKRAILDGRDRLTVVLKVHYEHKGEKPVGVECSFSDFCAADEEPYTRRFKVGGYQVGWKPLDLSYLQGKAGYVLIQNLEGQAHDTLPTEEEVVELAKRVIQVRFGDAIGVSCLDIPPGRFQLLRTSSTVYLCCDSDLTAQCRIYAFPD